MFIMLIVVIMLMIIMMATTTTHAAMMTVTVDKSTGSDIQCNLNSSQPCATIMQGVCQCRKNGLV